MLDLNFYVERFATWAFGAGVILALFLLLAVVAERSVVASLRNRHRRIERRYASIVRRALAGDDSAIAELTRSPKRHHIAIARILVLPLYDDPDPNRIARTREILRAMSLPEIGGRLLKSRSSWKRALALRVIGVLQERTFTPAVVAALDDPALEVRAVALDALADLKDPATLPAILVRLSDETQHRGRRLAALASWGSECEPMLLDLASIDSRNRFNYARALGVCGTARSRALLSQWTKDVDVEVRIAAFDALARIGLDTGAASLAVRGLESEDTRERAAAAHALHGWTETGDAAASLARHLDDDWGVAFRAAQSLKSMKESGAAALQAATSRPGLAGELARQALWELGAR